jgi:hypothetical protein
MRGGGCKHFNGPSVSIREGAFLLAERAVSLS